MANTVRKSGVIVFGSARSDGNTRKVADELHALTGFPVIDLNERKIGYFDYSRSAEDDFYPTMTLLLEYETILFVTPVYWYAMSAVMKTFLDRFSDLLMWRKDVGRSLRGKALGVVSSSGKPEIGHAFAYPFIETAKYLGMDYIGHVHCEIRRGEVTGPAKDRIAEFTRQIPSGMEMSPSGSL